MLSTCWSTLCILLFLTNYLAIAANSCSFCTRGKIAEPDKPIVIPGYEFLKTCGEFASILPAVLTEDDPNCQLMQSLSTYCGCPVPDNACSMCPDGSAASEPAKEVPWLASSFQGIVPSCGFVEAYAHSLSADDEMCTSLQATSYHCGCPALEDHCVFCPGETLQREYYDVELPFLSNEETNITGTCEMFYLTQYQIDKNHEVCDLSLYVTFHCGCNDGVLGYLGTSTTQQQAIVAWLPRAVGLLSLIGSCMVIWDILQSPKKRQSVYHQLIALISVFDVNTSLVWMVGTVAVPEQSELTGLKWGIYGARGNEASCKAQSFFFQLGFTSVFLSVSLTTYYYLVIVRGLREERLKQLRIWLFGPPVIVGAALAFAVIPFSSAAWLVCQFNTYPLDENLWKLLLFGIVPISSATACILVILVVIYYKVSAQRNRGKKWKFTRIKKGLQSMRNVVAPRHEDRAEEKPMRRRTSLFPQIRRPSSGDRLKKEVFWQCMSYAAAFGITWPVLCLAEFKGNDMTWPFWFWIIMVLVAPMQGLSNALCYFRPCRKKKKRPNHRASAASVTGETNHSTAQFLKKHVRRYSDILVSRRSAHQARSVVQSTDSSLGDPTTELANMTPIVNLVQEKIEDPDAAESFSCEAQEDDAVASSFAFEAQSRVSKELMQCVDRCRNELESGYGEGGSSGSGSSEDEYST